MSQTVEIPGQGIAEFPDEMTPDDIKGVIQNKFYASPTPSTEVTQSRMGLGDLLFDKETAQNLRGAIQDIVYSLPGMAAQIPKMAYQGLKFAAGGLQQQTQVAEEALTQAKIQGDQMAKDVLSPLGSRESFRGIANLGLMAAPAVGEALGEAALLGEAKPPIQGEALPQISETPISDAVQPQTGGIENAQQIQGSTRPDVNVQLPIGESAREINGGEVPTAIGSEGVSARGQGEIVQQTPQEVATVPQPEQPTGARPVSPVSEPTETASTQPLTFQTKLGSNYTVHEDGTTTRIKSIHPETPGDVGEKPKSINTFYVTPEQALKLGEVQAQGQSTELAQLPDGKWGMRYTDGPSKGKFESRTVTDVSTTPEVGLHPVEIFDEGKPHFGNQITKIGSETPPDVAETMPERQAQPAIPNSPTSLKNAVVDQEREARGLPSAVAPARQGFGELWDRVSQKIDQNPNYPDEVIQSLKDKSRAMTDEEDAALLHRQVDLQNQYSKVNEDVINAQKSGDSTTLTDASAKANALSDQLLEIYDIGKKGGTETGRGLAARKLLAQEDFSLANMITQKRAALMGKELSPEETGQVNQAFRRITAAQTAYDAYETSPKAEAYRKRLKTMAEDYRSRIEKGDFEPKPRNKLLLDTEGQKLKAEAERAKADWQRAVVKDRYTNRTPSQKFWDNFVGVERAFKLSSDVVLAKLTAAAGVRELGLTPLEQGIGSVTSKLIPGIARKAPRHGSGFSLDAEINAKREMFTTGMKDAWQNLKMKNTDLDELYKTGKIKAPEEFYDYMGYLHGALKAPIKRAEFARSLTHRMKWAAEHGQDLNNQSVMRQLSEQAYVDANRSIFLQDNIVSKGFNMINKWLETQKINPPAGQALSRINRFLIPIVKVPSNIVGEVAEGIHGVVSGGYKAAKAYVQGVNNLEPARADLIMRQINKGLIGNALILTGYLLRDKIGGFYHDQDKRSPQDVQPGRYRIGGFDLPASAGHSTGAMLLNIGATIGRVADEKVKKTGSEVKGTVEGLRAAGAGLAHEIPFVPAATNIIDAMDSKGGFTKYINNMITSTTTPAIFSHVAKVIDTPGTFPKNILDEATKRKPTTPVEALKMGIPGLRQTVPEKGEKASKNRPR